jgi:hypothetical protein
MISFWLFRCLGWRVRLFRIGLSGFTFLVLTKSEEKENKAINVAREVSTIRSQLIKQDK